MIIRCYINNLDIYYQLPSKYLKMNGNFDKFLDSIPSVNIPTKISLTLYVIFLDNFSNISYLINPFLL